MAEQDLLINLLPSILAIIITFVVLGVKKVGSTANSGIVGTTEIKHLHETLVEIKQRLENVCNRLDEVEGDLKLHSYRLDRWEANQNK